MKKLLLVLALLSIIFAGCNKEEKFDYKLKDLYGEWHGTDVYANNKWVNITVYPYTQFAFSIKFYKDGSYYGAGYFGNGEGTYEAKKSTIYTYVSGREYARYDIKEWNPSNGTAELIMKMGTSSMPIRVKKK